MGAENVSGEERGRVRGNRALRGWVALLAVLAAVLAAVLTYVALMAVLFAGGRWLLLWVLAGAALLGAAGVLLRRRRRSG